MDGHFFEAVLTSLFILAVFVLIFTHYSPLFILNSKNLPRGSFGWPLAGQTLKFLTPHNCYNLGPFLEDSISRYGSVFRSHLFGQPTIVSCDQELNYFILQNEEKLFQCHYPKSIHAILGSSSMLAVVGETHKRLRSLSIGLLTTIKSSATYVRDIEEIAVHILDSWKDGQTVCLYTEAKKFTFSVIVKQVLGLSEDDPESAQILKDFQTFMKGLISIPLNLPGSNYAKAVKARARIASTVKALVEKRREEGEDCKKKEDFLDVLLSTTSLSADEKVAFVLDALLGGYETTSNLIAVAVHFLYQYPSTFRKLKSEHQSIRTSKKKGECLHMEDYNKMHFTQNVINESLRCGNIVKFLHRKALKDVTFKGHLIPCGWKVLPMLSAVHLESSIHPNPQHFDPCRWEGEKNDINKKLTPFGGGTRLCPGYELSKIEVAIFLHHFVLKFRCRPDGEDSPIAYPYVEFPRGLPLQVEKIKLCI